MKLISSIACAAFALCAASAAQAASSDYLLEIEGVKGETAVDSWSFGVCNQGQCSASSKRSIVSSREASSGMATGKTKPKPSTASWDLATSKGARSAAGGVTVATGDVDGDGHADLSFAGTQPEISSLSLTFHKIPADYRAVCDGKHFDKAVLRNAADSYELTDVTVTCTVPSGTGTSRIDPTPARISTNMAAARESSAPSISERCVNGTCSADALTDGLLILRFTGGQMKHTKTGHVTLLK